MHTECDREGALMCLGVKRWADYHILPLVQAGIQPSHTIIKSIHKVCNHGYINYLRREFLVAHIRRALGLLRPGGMLISLCYDGVQQNKNLRPITNSWEVLPPGTFRSEGTNAGVVLLTIEK